MESRTLVMGDIHGNIKALKQCLERSGFDKQKDTLIQLGDVCDGHKYVYECVELLLTIKNLIPIIGNHDDWFKSFLTLGFHPDGWWQGGIGTAKSYLRLTDREHLIMPDTWGNNKYICPLIPEDIPESHVNFFMNQRLYYLDDKKRLFVHAGFDRTMKLKDIKRLKPHTFFWDRRLWSGALSCSKNDTYKINEDVSEIFIGHTATNNYDKGGKPILEPMSAGIITNVDTGAGVLGSLTIMDVDTKQFWQSDTTLELYVYGE